jgi:hypothetical protein
VDEVVINKHVGLRDELFRAESDQTKVAGTGANEMNDTSGRHEGRSYKRKDREGRKEEKNLRAPTFAPFAIFALRNLKSEMF